ncbi:MAG: DUF3465 domain-containing protein [Gammaproteobacteria bacterium]
MKNLVRNILTVLVLGIAAIYQFLQEKNPDNTTANQNVQEPEFQQQSANRPGNDLDIKQLKPGKWVTLSGKVSRILPDDNQGSRHQKFILKLNKKTTLLIAHNIDLADRVPLDKGDQITLRGRYEKNDRGGVIHWTHHDPQRAAKAGWIEHSGIRYE